MQLGHPISWKISNPSNNEDPVRIIYLTNKEFTIIEYLIKWKIPVWLCYVISFPGDLRK